MSDAQLLRLIRRRRAIYLVIWVVTLFVIYPLLFYITQLFGADMLTYIFTIICILVTGIMGGLMETCCIGICNIIYNKPTHGGFVGIICFLLSYIIFGWVIVTLTNLSERLFCKVVGIG